MYFTLPEVLQFRVWHILLFFTHKMLSSSLLLVCLIPDVTSLKLYFNWLFNIYLSPVQKRNCQKCRYLNSKYSIKINAVWQSSQDTSSEQQKYFLMKQIQLGSSMFVLLNKTLAWLSIWSIIHFINSNKINGLWMPDVRWDLCIVFLTNLCLWADSTVRQQIKTEELGAGNKLW